MIPMVMMVKQATVATEAMRATVTSGEKKRPGNTKQVFIIGNHGNHECTKKSHTCWQEGVLPVLSPPKSCAQCICNKGAKYYGRSIYEKTTTNIAWQILELFQSI